MLNHLRTSEFLNRFKVEALGDSRFTAECHPAWPGRAFGGQLAAQSLMAAAATVQDSAKEPASLHICFTAPVQSGVPIVYAVESLKEGKTLATRLVRILQNDVLRATANILFSSAADGPSHESQRPEVTAPEYLPSEERLIHPTIAPIDADFEAMGYPMDSMIELKIERKKHQNEGLEDYAQKAWMRVSTELPIDALISASVLAYLSDITLGTTLLEAHGGRSKTTDLQLGAIELALWFFKPTTPSDWILFSQNAPFAGRGRGAAYGAFRNQQGELCAVAFQNALMRYKLL